MEQRSTDLRDYLLPLAKWWWLIVAATLVATVSSFLAVRQQPPIYQTRVTVMVGSAMENPNPSGNEFWLTQQLANTYADIVKREPVRNATMAALGLSWLPDYTARVVPNTQLVEIIVTDVNPRRTQAVANELANQLIRLSPSSSMREDQQRQAFVSRQLSELEAKIDETQDEIARKQADLASMFSARQIADTQAQIAGLQNKLTTLQANYAALLANTQKGALNTITVIEPAALPTTPVGPNRLATVLLAAAIGFALAAGAAYLLEYLDDTLKNPEDVQRAVGLTTLGAIPHFDGASGSGELVVLSEGHSAAREAFRVLRTNLQFASVNRSISSLLVTSPAPSEGKSVTAANLAAALAQADKRVILVDTDLHRPRLHKLLQLRNNVGVTSALLEEHPDLDLLLQDTAQPGLRVLTSGPLPPNPAELLGSRRMRELLGTLKSRADVIVLDSPPVTALSDAAILGTQVDGALLVLDVGATRREVARRAVEALRRVNAHIVGALLNRMPVKGAGYYYYYYYGYYDYAGSGDGHNGKPGKGRRNGSRLLGGQQAKPPVAEEALRSLSGQSSPRS